MVIGLQQNVTVYLNAFPHANDVSDLALLFIAKGKALDFVLHCQVEFGAYAQIRNLSKNNMCVHIVGAIAMNPSHNYQGGVLFLSERSFLSFLGYEFVPILPHENGALTSRKIKNPPNVHP